uniref:Putative alkylated dna repair protein n=1 Tax=Tabanus bromius TaxID=304241 RepID=A0A0K8TSE9_TABBR
MNFVRLCGCKGRRSCLACEASFNLPRKDYFASLKAFNSYAFCYKCKKLYPGWDAHQVIFDHHKHRPADGLDNPGICVFGNFLDMWEAEKVLDSLERTNWSTSQSGRRKQNFGPIVNFKKMKIAVGDFVGFPLYAKFIHERLRAYPKLENFCPIEQCALDYNPEKGASIDPHIDDCWVWGDRVATVNCCGDSVLTLTKYKGDCYKYNLEFAASSGCITGTADTLQNHTTMRDWNDIVIRILMPELSLVVLHGPARYQFEHTILREDILERRICLTFREFSSPFKLGGDQYGIGKLIAAKASQFW